MHRKFSIFHSALLLTGVNLLLRLVSTSFQVYISGQLGAEGVGLLQLVLSVGMLSMTAGVAGVRTATMYLTAEELGKKRPQNVVWILSGCFLYSIICSGVIAAALYIFAPIISQSWIAEPSTLGAIRLLAAFLPVSCLCGVMTGYFTAANRIGTLAAVEVAEQAASMLVTMLGLTLWAKQDPGKACQVVVFGSGVGSCLTLVVLSFLRLRENAVIGQRIPVRSRLVQTAAPLALADDLKSGISTLENLMVPKRLALYPSAVTPLAAFGTVCGMVFPILMFPAAIVFGLNELLIPELARCNAAGSEKRIRYLVKRSLRCVIVYGCFICGGEFLLSSTLCQALYGSATAGAYLKLYALLIPMLYCDAVTDAMTKGLGQQRACVRYNIITSALDVVLLYLMLPKFGMGGYFYSFLVTHFINFVLSLRRLIRISKVRINWVIPILALLSTVGAIWICSHLAEGFLRLVAYILTLGCLLFLLRVIRKKDILWLKGLIKQKGNA